MDRAHQEAATARVPGHVLGQQARIAEAHRDLGPGERGGVGVEARGHRRELRIADQPREGGVAHHPPREPGDGVVVQPTQRDRAIAS